MSKNKRYYPTISSIVTPEDIPDILGFVKDGILNIFDKIHYKDLQYSKSPKGDAAFYSLSIVTKDRLDIKVPGTEIYLVLNPDADDKTISAFPITINYQWKILAFLRSFQLGNFAFSPQEIFELCLKVLNISEEQALAHFINNFVTPADDSISRITQFVNDIKDKSGIDLDIPTEELSLTKIVKKLYKEKGKYSSSIVFGIYILRDDLQETKDKLELYIQSFLPQDLDAYIKDLVIPTARATLTLSAAIEFPRKVLQPVFNEAGENPFDSEQKGIPFDVIPVIPSNLDNPNLEFPKVSLSFGKALFYADTQNGLGYQMDLVLNTNVPAQIGNTGLIIDIKNVKLDLSRQRNIAEANAEGRPVDFIGAFVEEASIRLPEKWFKKQEGNSLSIKGRNLLIGTGGISGTIGLEVTGDADTSNKLEFTLGKKKADESGRKGFKLGFEHFHMTWYQGALVETTIKGSVTIPKFKRCDASGNLINGPLTIGVEVLFEQDGDFQITAKPEEPIYFCFGEVFMLSLDGLEVGKDDDKAFLCLSGGISFDNNPALKSIFSDPFEIKELCIYSDGSFELAGGSIPLPEGVILPLGVVDVTITNLSFGAEEREHNNVLRKYKYFGLDCGLGIGAAGLDLRGDGIAYYFTVDDDEHGGDSHKFFRIEGIGIDLIIPGGATKEEIALIVQGYLSITKNEYLGSVSFELPKVGLSGGAVMKMQPKIPAWIVDAEVGLATPIPLATTGLGIYGFRGLFGYRYVAAKEAAGLNEENTWMDYYKAPSEGLNLEKMHSPDKEENAGSPISIGAGVTIATMGDNGKAISMQAFLLISLPEVILLAANVRFIGKRAELLGDEPPFYVLVDYTPKESIGLTLEANYKLREAGKLISIEAGVQSRFFFQNSRGWYANFGTKETPSKARIFDLFNAYSYLMLNSSGIDARAMVDFGFEKKFGPLKVEVEAVLDIRGSLSYQGPQLGGSVLVSGCAKAKIWKFGPSFNLNTSLEATVPKPFKISGKVEICVSVNLLFKSFDQCVNLGFTWFKDRESDKSPILPLPSGNINIEDAQKTPVSALHIGSGKTYPIDYFGAAPQPSKGEITALIPLDSFIDIQFDKPVDASNIRDIIGEVTNAPQGNKELVPPKRTFKQVIHNYKVKKLRLMIHNGNAWVDYHPYEALTEGAVLSDTPINLSDYKIGAFQKKGLEYNNIRLLSQTPFSFLNSSSGDYDSERNGVTSSTLFCEEKKKKINCAFWNKPTTYRKGQLYIQKGLTFAIKNKQGKVVDFPNVYSIPQSLAITNGAVIECFLPQLSSYISLKLFTFSSKVTIKFYRRDMSADQVEDIYREILVIQKNKTTLLQPVIYSNENEPIDKIVIEPATVDTDRLRDVEIAIDELWEEAYTSGKVKELAKELEALNDERDEILAVGCSGKKDKFSISTITEKELEKCKSDLKKTELKIEELKKEYKFACSNRDNLTTELDEGLINLKKNTSPSLNRNTIKRLQKELLKNKNSKSVDKKLKEIKAQLIKEEAAKNKSVQYLIKSASKLLSNAKNECINLSTQILKANFKIKNLTKKINELELYLDKLNTLSQAPNIDYCGTYLHEVCWLTTEHHEYNESIPNQAAIEENYQLNKSAMENVIAPIWRPDATYLVQVQVSDTVTQVSESSSDSDRTTETTKDIYFGFRTKGPIGHFPEDAVKGSDKEEFDAAETAASSSDKPNYDDKIEVPETSLKYYIDNQRSYPDPRGKILSSKPLYYKQAKLSLFFKHPFVYHFFGTWASYQSMPAKEGKMEIVIKDPVEDIATPSDTGINAPLVTEFPTSFVDWKLDLTPRISRDIKLYDSLRNPERNNPDYPGATCWESGADPIKPASKAPEIIAKDLKPLKLYTAIVKNKYEGIAKEVHRYAFQTSKYGDFKEHIDSYHLKDNKENSGDAIFRLEIDFNINNVQPVTNINRTFEIIKNVESDLSNYNKKLAKVYTDPFQRLVEGHLKMPPLHPCLGLEFNFIYETEGEDILGILICSPEPLNDPKITLDYLEDSIQVYEKDKLSSDYHFLFAKDLTKVFVMNKDKKITTDNLKINFSYLEWNGKDYNKSEVMTGNLIPQS